MPQSCKADGRPDEEVAAEAFGNQITCNVEEKISRNTFFARVSSAVFMARLESCHVGSLEQVSCKGKGCFETCKGLQIERFFGCFCTFQLCSDGLGSHRCTLWAMSGTF